MYEVELVGPQSQHEASVLTSKTFRVTHGGSYTVSVVALDGPRNYSTWTTPIPVEVAIDTGPPTDPTDLRATVDASGALDRIEWDPSVDDSGSVKYELWSAEAGFLVYTRQPGIDAWDLTDFYCVVLLGETHTLTVRAFDPARQYTAWSNPLTMTF